MMKLVLSVLLFLLCVAPSWADSYAFDIKKKGNEAIRLKLKSAGEVKGAILVKTRTLRGVELSGTYSKVETGDPWVSKTRLRLRTPEGERMHGVITTTSTYDGGGMVYFHHRFEGRISDPKLLRRGKPAFSYRSVTVMTVLL